MRLRIVSSPDILDGTVKVDQSSPEPALKLPSPTESPPAPKTPPISPLLPIDALRALFEKPEPPTEPPFSACDTPRPSSPPPLATKTAPSCAPPVWTSLPSALGSLASACSSPPSASNSPASRPPPPPEILRWRVSERTSPNWDPCSPLRGLTSPASAPAWLAAPSAPPLPAAPMPPTPPTETMPTETTPDTATTTPAPPAPSPWSPPPHSSPPIIPKRERSTSPLPLRPQSPASPKRRPTWMTAGLLPSKSLEVRTARAHPSPSPATTDGQPDTPVVKTEPGALDDFVADVAALIETVTDISLVQIAFVSGWARLTRAVFEGLTEVPNLTLSFTARTHTGARVHPDGPREDADPAWPGRDVSYELRISAGTTRDLLRAASRCVILAAQRARHGQRYRLRLETTYRIYDA